MLARAATRLSKNCKLASPGSFVALSRFEDCKLWQQSCDQPFWSLPVNQRPSPFPLWPAGHLTFAAANAFFSTAQPHSLSPTTEEKQQAVLVYKGRGMQLFRLLVRFKVFQLLGVAALAIPINTMFAEGSLTSVQVLLASSLLIGCAAASTTLYFYSRRYVGQLQYLAHAEEPQLCFSVLDFWGHRQDNWVPLRELIAPFKDLPPESIADIAAKPLIPLDVAGDRQYYMSVRYGYLVDRQLLQQILDGSLHPSDS